jgi:uncharacterized protein (DUF924 family)
VTSHAGGTGGPAPSAAEALLGFWFGRAPLSDAAFAERQRKWFAADPGFDAALRARFAPLVADAAAGALDAWCASPRGRMALILLLDQLPRNLFRGEARAFATDPQALACTLAGIDAGHDRALPLVERSFFYLPLQHAEDLAMQELCVAMCDALVREAPPARRAALEDFAVYAVRHRDLIARFGRFPHRNRVLGRAPTAAETQYLAGGGERFGQ